MGVGSVFRSGLLQGKVALVSGGGSGIGLCISRELLHLGCDVVIAARNVQRLQTAATELKAEFPKRRVEAIQCNIRNEEQVKGLFDATLARFGRLDYLVNNGGGQFPSPAADISLKGWNAVVDTNLTGTFLMCKQAHSSWMKHHGGSIVNIITCMFNGWTNMAHSGAARAGVENLTKTLAVEWAEDGVRLNAVAPGVIYVASAVAAYGERGEELFRSGLPRIPARRFGNPEEVSAAVTYLLSPAAAYVTGTTLKVDGAWSLYHQQTWEVPDHDKTPVYSWTDAKSKL